MNPVIEIKGAWAELRGAPKRIFEECLTVLDPKRFFNRAFKERRWDGRVRLYESYYEGNRFPAGLMGRVVAHLNDDGSDVHVIAREEAEPIDLSRLDKTYLGKVGPKRDNDLWDHQVEAVKVLLSQQRGVLKVPTGGGKTEIAAVGARYLWEERGWRSLIVVPRRGLAKQTAERLQRYYEDDIEVGQCGDGKREIGAITVGTAQTLIKFMPSQRRNRKTKRIQCIPADAELARLVRQVEVLWLDECHHSSSESWYTIAMHSGAVRRYGLSGTPLKNEEVADMRMVGATGEIIYEVSPQVLIDLGLAACPKVCIVTSPAASGPTLPPTWRTKVIDGVEVDVQGPLPYAEAYQQGVVENEHHNRAVIRATEWLVDQRKQTLILCRRKPHWRRLRELLDDSGIEFMAVWGDTDTAERDRAKELLDTRKIGVVLATTIFDEGEDVPGIEAIVLAEGVKVPTNTLQRIGRGMRKKKGDNEVWIVDFCPTCHEKLTEHAAQRAETYAGEGYEVLVWEDWPKMGAEFDGVLLPFLNWAEALAEASA